MNGVAVFFFLCSIYAFALVAKGQTTNCDLFYFKAHQAKMMRTAALSTAALVVILGTMEALSCSELLAARTIVEHLPWSILTSPYSSTRILVAKHLRMAASLSLGHKDKLNHLAAYAASIGQHDLAEEITGEAQAKWPQRYAAALTGLQKALFIQADTYDYDTSYIPFYTDSNPMVTQWYPALAQDQLEVIRSNASPTSESDNSDSNYQQALWNATNDIRIDGRPENYVRRAKIYDAMGLTQQAKQDLIMAESIDNDFDVFF
jgi:tetratricopeptide (TPR) repeat protein